MAIKSTLFILVFLLIFTQGLITLHYSRFEKGEYDRICNALYTERFWIDKCYFTYNSEIKTFDLARNIEIAGIILIGGVLMLGR